MMNDDLDANARIVFLTAPHPATRLAVAFLASALAASEESISCELVTASDAAPPLGIAVYLRAGVTDAVDLLATTGLHGGPPARQACALLAALDDQWHGVPRLSLETVLDTPQAAVRQVACYAGVAIGEPVFVAVDAHIAVLRDAVAGYRHALPFLAAVEVETHDLASMDEGLQAVKDTGAVARLVAPDVPRRMLIVDQACSMTSASPAPMEGWQRIHVSLAEAMTHPPAPADERFGLIHFNHLQGAGLLGDMLNRAMAWLAPGGLLYGEELTDTAAEAAVAQLTKMGDQHQLVFVLSGTDWVAIAPAWWR